MSNLRNLDIEKGEGLHSVCSTSRVLFLEPKLLCYRAMNFMFFQIHGRRHLIFASDKQLEILSQSKTWYMDATFKLCRHPFTQLFTVNAFVKKDNHVKQVPLAFALMSGRKKGDYKAVLQALLSILPNNPRVKKVTLDFEKAMWSATRQVLPNIKLMGCSFHFTQALWRKVRTTVCACQYHAFLVLDPRSIETNKKFAVLKLQRLTFTINALSLKLFLSNVLPSNARTATTVIVFFYLLL